MRHHFRRKSDWIMFANSVILLSAWIIGMYWYFWPYDIVSFPTQEIQIMNPGHIVRAGDQIQWLIEADQHTSGIKVDTSITLTDGISINFTPRSYVTKRGHIKRVDSSYTIPDYAPVGKYRLVLTSTFHVNPIRTITITRESEEFTITHK